MSTIRLLLVCAASAALAGCYTLGDARPSMMRGITTLSVPVSKNETLEPNVEGVLADTIVKAIQTDGTYSVNYTKHADAIVYTTLHSSTSAAPHVPSAATSSPRANTR